MSGPGTLRRGAARWLLLLAAATALTATVTVAATGVAGASGAGAAVPSQETHAVGELTETYVDTHRPTAAWGTSPARSSRTLVTTVFYPAVGPAGAGPPQPSAVPDRSAGPFPLIVFAHGLGADPQQYESLLRYWAGAGFVVAAPLFPLTSALTPGGPDAGDVVNQPGDMRFVITSVLAASAQPGGPLSGLVDPREIGAAGHSNGAITTLGLVADTCCLDHRVRAAVVMAGTTEGYPGGRYDFAEAPPLLLVNGTADQLIPYPLGVAVFNGARGPKGLLTIKGGSHEAAAAQSPDSAGAVLRTTTAFFEAYLRGDHAALAGLGRARASGVTTLHLDTRPGSTATIPTLPAPTLHLQASVTPTTHLVGGESVTVRWRGYSAGRVVNVVECNASDQHLNSSAACSFTHARILTPDPTGAGSLRLEIVEGAVGSGTCDATHPGCLVVVNNASSTAPSSSVRIPISFAR